MVLYPNEILDITSPNKNTMIRKTSVTRTNGNAGKSKKKGNKYENDIAKALGIWMFNDKDSLCRSITSGARKTVYTGDIVPQKQLPNGNFMWHIECKNGYKNRIPSFNNFTLVEEWLIKCLEDVNFERQPLIWLICRFHGYSSIVFTNCPFKNISWNLCVNIAHNNLYNYFYNYKLDNLFDHDFNVIKQL
jgi:hypothetical protein